ncbi:MAG: thiolase domain-containing protein [Anaerolineae bacterium]|nr:thiolase domain-containing protein [Anaerolineae bacterium]
MRDVAIIGIGKTPVGEHWGQSLRDLAAEAVGEAVQDGGVSGVDALIVGNAFGASFSSQSQLGALIADYTGLAPTEAWTVEAADASGGAALRAGYLAIASGQVDVAVVVGVEKSTDSIAATRVKARNVSLDADYEAAHGLTQTAQAALVMRRYMHEYGVELGAFEGFSINAHANAKGNKGAMFQNQLKPGAFAKASMVADPVNLFDGAPDADGAAAVVLVSAEYARELGKTGILIAGSAGATDRLTLHERSDVLHLEAVRQSAMKAMAQAEVSLSDLNLLELHDGFTILTTLALEAMGFAARGQGWQLAAEAGAHLRPTGRLPISTFGGLKARGNPVGATGVYQAVEAVSQLRGTAGANQVQGAQTALIQSVGGFGSTAITHILQVVR